MRTKKSYKGRKHNRFTSYSITSICLHVWYVRHCLIIHYVLDTLSAL